MGRTWLSTPSGYLSKELGWVGFWGFTILAAVPGMALLLMLWRKGYVVQSVRQPSTEDDGPQAAPASS
jgi:PAT family beta-lactamase induction signal transducer AmpG